MQQERNQKQNLSLIQKSIRKRENIGMYAPPVRVVVGFMGKKLPILLLLQKLYAVTSAKATDTS